MYCQIHHGPWTGTTPYHADYDPRGSTSPFSYYFADAPVQAADPRVLAALDSLADAMIAQGGDPARNSGIPPFFTYFGQFIDHDITAGTDRDQTDAKIDSPELVPRSRDEVLATTRNLRSGKLDLDSVYGSELQDLLATQTDRDFMAKLTRHLRYHGDRSRMWVAHYEGESDTHRPNPEAGVDLPVDRAGDLLRLGQLLDGPEPRITEAEMQWLSDGLREVFLHDDGTPNVHRAIIGDARNDENLIVAQVHLAFLRLHNVIASCCRDEDVRDGGPDAVYEWARDRVRWIYQWQIVNSYLPAVCHAPTLKKVIASEASLYRGMFGHSDCAAGHRPMPIEFSAAAFRFGHSMVRPSYDWNRFFGRGRPDQAQIIPTAPFELIFSFTGTNKLGGVGVDRLPANWGADWPRMVDGPAAGFEDRSARKIDTQLALPLTALPGGLPGSVLAHLAKRNLRRGYMLNVPCAQDCIAALHGADPDIPVLTPEQMGDGAVRAALESGGMMERTPLWYYILREAEVLCDGESLGPLGTHLVAQTLLGLVVSDVESYWHKIGSDDGRWQPSDLRIDGIAAIKDIASMLAVAGLHTVPAVERVLEPAD